MDAETTEALSQNKLGILNVLEAQGFDLNCKAMLLRHTKRQYLSLDWLPLYQSIQSKPRFNGLNFIVSFTDDGSHRARFYGVYRILEERELNPDDIPSDSPFVDRRCREDYFFYKLEHQAQFADLQGRVIIDWGKGVLSWAQHMTNKPVLEILPMNRASRVLQPFTDYLDFTLSHGELREMMGNPEAYNDWEASLSAVAGVYLVLAETTGEQYVGSAYGESGVWGRWKDYAVNGHGGNTLLKEMVNEDNSYPEAFRYSVLQVLPKSTTDSEIIRWEQRYKDKLGSRAVGLGLNAN